MGGGWTLAALVLVVLLLAQPAAAVDPIPPEPPKDGGNPIFDAIINALKAFFNWLVEQIWRLLGDVGGTIADALGKVGELIKNAWDFFSSALGAVRDFFGLLARGVELVRRVIGSTGDPSLYTYVQARLATQACCSTSPRAREVAAEALANCSRYRLKDVAWLVDPRLANDTRTLCDVAPSGFLGFLSMGFWLAESSRGIVVWFFQNFLLVHAAAFGSTLMMSAAAAVRRRSFEPLERWARAWGKYIGLYVRFFRWILEKLMWLAEVVAELLPL